MKKFLCLFLSVVMILSLCFAMVGCTTEDTDDVRGDVIKNDEEKEPAKDKKPTEATNPTETTTPTQQKTEPEFALGQFNGGTYRNDFLGLSCTLPGDWMFYTDEQMKQLNNITGDVLGKDLAEQLKNATIIYDMQAQHVTDGSTIGVNMEKLAALQIVALNIKENLEAQIPTIENTYAQMGFTDVKVKYEKVTVDGKEFDGISLTAKIQNVDFAMVLFTFKKANYLANVSIGTLQNNLDTLLVMQLHTAT